MLFFSAFEPDWGHWSHLDPGVLRASRTHSPLVPSEWMAVIIQALADEKVLVKNRGRDQAFPNRGKGDKEAS